MQLDWIHRLDGRALGLIGAPSHAALAQLITRQQVEPADVVLDLLHRNQLDIVELILGKPIQVGPAPDLAARWRAHCRPRPPEPRIRHVHPDPRYYCKNRNGDYYNRPLQDTMLARYELLRPMMPVSTALARGVTRKDLRLWRHQGWVEVS
jgi:hypothetical protein